MFQGEDTLELSYFFYELVRMILKTNIFQRQRKYTLGLSQLCDPISEMIFDFKSLDACIYIDDYYDRDKMVSVIESTPPLIIMIPCQLYYKDF